MSRSFASVQTTGDVDSDAVTYWVGGTDPAAPCPMAMGTDEAGTKVEDGAWAGWSDAEVGGWVVTAVADAAWDGLVAAGAAAGVDTDMRRAGAAFPGCVMGAETGWGLI